MLVFLWSIPLCSKAQAPPNDDCANASQIVVGKHGYATGLFSSVKVNLRSATIQPGESFPPLQFYAGTNKKSVWYSFNVAVHRNVSVTLRQNDSAIDQNAVGFSVYKANDCPPNLGELSNSLPLLSKFGSSVNTCLAPGTYMIQVSAMQSANDSIWIDLNVSAASGALFDEQQNAYNLGVVQGIATASYTIGCLSTDDPTELCTAFGATDSEYNQSSWVSFKTPVYSDAFNFSFEVDNKLSADSAFGFNVYEYDPNSGALNLASGCNLVKMPAGPLSVFYYPGTRLLCNVKPNTSYVLQIFFWKYSQCNLTVTVSDFGEDTAMASDPKHLPQSYQLGDIPSGKSKSVDDFFACNSRMSLHPCGTDQPDNYVNGTDTLDLSTWLTFSVAEEGSIKITTTVKYCNPRNPEYLLRYYRLYKGDITKDCNLSLDYDGWGDNTCITPGTYSYQVVASSNRHQDPNDFCFDVDLGKSEVTTVSFTAKVKQPLSKYYLSSTAEDLGDIYPTLKSKGADTALQDYFDSIPSADSIGGNPIYSYALLRQFYISHPVYIKIFDTPINPPAISNGPGNGYLYAGKATNGLKTIRNLNARYVNTSVPGNFLFYSGCAALPVGWYTVISTYRSDICGMPSIIANNIVIDTFSYCPPTFNRPYRAGLVNNLAALPTGNTEFPPECLGCHIDTPYAGKLAPCSYKKDSPYVKVSFYVFYLNKESYALFRGGTAGPQWNFNYLLYKGDVRKDSSFLGNPSKSIRPCNNSNEFCRLQPGLYTMVIFNNASATFNSAYNIYIAPMVNAKYDFAAHADDLGMVPMNGSTVLSDKDNFGCTTGAFSSDPGFNAADTSILYFGGGKSTVPIPMPQNYNNKDVVDSNGRLLSRYVQRNVWFTFTLAGTGEFNVVMFQNNSVNQYPLVLRSGRNGVIPFKILQANHQVDSTMAQGLSNVSYIYQNDQDFIVKNDCDTVRYYAVAYFNQDAYLDGNVSITVNYNGIAYPKAGDYCTNAIPIQLNYFGSAAGTATVNCHTTGESFGEDGSNMGCLNQASAYKTTWFKITESAGSKADLTFTVANRTNMPNSQISYRVLYGSCDAMTPGPCVSDANASFTLDCMGEGDYYIQVSEPALAAGQISLTASAATPKYSSCKPSPPFQPLANFYTTGGCNHHPVNFINLSTAGNGVKYYWDFGNGQKSGVKSPTVPFNSKNSIDTFIVTLKVTDTIHHLSDSLSLPVYIFKDTITLKVISPVSVTCTGKVELHTVCNYPNALYHWSPETLLDNAYIADPIADVYSDTTLYLTVNAANCTLYDSVRIKLDHRIQIKTNNGFCTGNSDTLFGAPGYSAYKWYDGKNYYTTQDITINKPGIYSLLATKYPGGCISYDTIQINGKGVDNVALGKDTSLCIGQYVKLTAPLQGSYLWSTGDTTRSISVGQPGIYTVTIKLGLCTVYGKEQVFISPFPKINTGSGDTAFCAGDSGIISVGYLPGTKYNWSSGDTTNAIKVKNTGVYKVKISLGYCDTVISKKVDVEALPKPELGKDTVSCYAFEKTLDAGPGLSYSWYPGGETTEAITVRKEGTYAVTVSNGPGCQNADTIVLTMHCEDGTLFVPNSFTPDLNSINDIFKAEGTHITAFKMTVYNRWGELLFETTDMNNGWNGTFKQLACPMDVYLWIINYTAYATKKIMSGTVTLLR